MKSIVYSVSCTFLVLHIHKVLAGTHLRRQPVGQDSNTSLDPTRKHRRLPHSKGGPPDDSVPPFFEPLDTPSPTTIPRNTPSPSPEFVPLPSTEPVVITETSPQTPQPTPAPTPMPTAQIITNAPMAAAPSDSPMQPQAAPPTTDNIFKPENPDSETSSAPQDPQTHASCEAAKKGEVYTTGKSIIVEINYELLTKAGSPLPLVASTLDGLFQDYAAVKLVNCTLGEASDIQGVAVNTQSSVVDRNCRYISGFNTTSFYCFVMKGALKVFKSDNTTIADNEIRSSVWSTLRLAINGPTPKGRALEETESIFINEEKGIVDLYLMDQGTESISQMNGQDSNQSTGKSISSGASAVIGIFFASVVAAALVYIRRRKDRSGRSYAQKMTVIADGNSYLDDSDTYISPREDSYSSHGKLPGQLETEIATIDPPTPSQLSCPMSCSASESLPSVSLFEAYEATPTERGDSISYDIIHMKHSSKRKIQTQNVLPLGPMRSRSILNISDELSEAPPPFAAKASRSISKNSAKTPQSQRSKSSSDAAIHYDQRNLPQRTRSRPDPPCVPDPRESTCDDSEEYECRGISKYDQSTDDSFSVKAFLNGHCAAMESFYGSMISEEDSLYQGSTKPSPTSVASLWSEPKLPSSSIMGKNYKSSINVWMSQCGEASNDDDVEPWTIIPKTHMNTCSPYGIKASQTPSTKTHFSRGWSESSPDRGRSPTPILDSTNSRRSRSRHKTPDRKERNPPGHKIISVPQRQPINEILTIPSPSSRPRSSSKSKSPFPRYVTPTSTRGLTRYPECAADTVEL